MKPEDIARERAKWHWTGSVRPPFAEAPAPGEESVWDYPRPPRVEAVTERVRVEFAGALVAASNAALRVLETAGPAVYYVPSEDVVSDALRAESGKSHCEWKGVASYYSLEVAGRVAPRAVWCYRHPDPAFASIRDHFAFHAGRVDACFVGEARVTPQPGDYYGGWITPGVVGPFKGEPGTENW